ncbi:conserved hypothetical protein [Stenotrophomonas maltophilia K279a]|uniref:Uncharacterized protein n=1 Tax=Stenotrophomonas maltophilia (strain K279a) TaxID=522373 RepID=B2FMH0_STRMK|nr:conserved hypothetical protein [Stenotrophomonas maltophilia K279a]
MPTLVGAVSFVPTKVGTHQGDVAVVTGGGSAGRWPEAGVGGCRPWSALWVSCQPRLAPTRAMHRLLHGVVPAAGRQPFLVDADPGRRREFRANQGRHPPGRCGGCYRGGSAGRWPATVAGRCRPWSALWVSCQPRLAPTRAMCR